MTTTAAGKMVRWLLAGATSVALWRRLEELVQVGMGYVLPCSCCVCDAPDVTLCRSCQRLVRAGLRRVRRVEQHALALPLLDGRPLPVVAGGEYRGPLALTLLNGKRYGDTSCARVLAVGFRNALESLCRTRGLMDPRAPIFLVPMPTRLPSQLARGFNPVELILKHVRLRDVLGAGPQRWLCYRFRAQLVAVLAKLLGTWAPTRLLLDWLGKRYRWFQALGSQKGSSGSQRRTHLRNTMRASSRALRAQRLWAQQGLPLQVVLCDDVLTTGATLNEATRALTEAGLTVVGAIVIASTVAPRSTVATELEEDTAEP